ncbi:outer membrane beta-barrel domain-containing protein [Bdellovibrio sp. HCB337]|uniref:outer membrane beta-barrel domain-containing protein n=1 Tax=Bdellovibrio sp. HCB337 TaxID=3394358 RepID=UPI0039A4A744
MKKLLLATTTVLFAVAANAAPKATQPETQPEAKQETKQEAKADSTETQFDALGGNQIFLDKAKALEPEKNVSIVQNRSVPLTNRVEFAPEFSGTFGGDTYSRTKSIGLNAMYHINPRWAIGAKYNYSFNSLTPEGEAMVDQAYAEYQKNPANPDAAFPEMDYQKSEMMALVNWAPVYGKMNLLDKSVAHFDFYLVGGYGQTELKSGAVPTMTAGGGLGFWISKHFSTRLEMRYQTYTAKYFETEKKMDLAVASVQMGWLL